jgi:3-hydroxyacyl-[acyl-carrier-protein] dehydratase
MPSQLLIDVSRLDLEHVHATHAEIYAKDLPHRGRFALLDGVCAFDPADGGCSVGWKDIRADDWWACDHIPGRPLFPGVLMIEGGAQLASWDHRQRMHRAPGFIGFGGVNETRFRSTVEPGVRLHWVARMLKTRSRMFVYAVQGLVAGELVFETEVIGAIV